LAQTPHFKVNLTLSGPCSHQQALLMQVLKRVSNVSLEHEKSETDKCPILLNHYLGDCRAWWSRCNVLVARLAVCELEPG
jgi:hypothetical protein